MKKLLIIIPTLNESKNVTIIFNRIKKFQRKSDILFIDDNSIVCHFLFEENLYI